MLRQARKSRRTGADSGLTRRIARDTMRDIARIPTVEAMQMRIERELMRGAGPVAVREVLERGGMFGYEMVETLSEQTKGVLGMGQSTLYPMLYNLQAKGLITSRRRLAGSGRQRRYYALTKKGARRLDSETRQWQALVRALGALGIAAGREHGASIAKAAPG